MALFFRAPAPLAGDDMPRPDFVGSDMRGIDLRMADLRWAEVIAMAMIRLGGLTAYTMAWFPDPGTAVRAILHGACDTAAEYRDGSAVYCVRHGDDLGDDRYVGVDGARVMTPADAAAIVRAMPRHEDDDGEVIEKLVSAIERWRRMPR